MGNTKTKMKDGYDIMKILSQKIFLDYPTIESGSEIMLFTKDVGGYEPIESKNGDNINPNSLTILAYPNYLINPSTRFHSLEIEKGKEYDTYIFKCLDKNKTNKSVDLTYYFFNKDKYDLSIPRFSIKEMEERNNIIDNYQFEFLNTLGNEGKFDIEVLDETSKLFEDNAKIEYLIGDLFPKDLYFVDKGILRYDEDGELEIDDVYELFLEKLNVVK